MSDAGDEIQVDAAPVEVEVTTEAPKGKMSVEDALQVCQLELFTKFTDS
jgi:small subunit ribosomal protein S12e